MAQRLSEDALHKSEEQYRLLVESARGFAMFMLDADGCIASWNTGAQRIFDYTEHETIGQSFALLFTEEDRGAGIPEDELRRARHEGTSEDMRWHRRKDGTLLWANGLVTAVYDENSNAVRGFVKVLRDDTAHKRAEEALAKEKECLAVTLNSMSEGLITADREARVVLLNRAAEALLGITDREAQGKPVAEVFCVLDDATRRPLADPLNKILKGKLVAELAAPAVLKRRDGTERIVSYDGAPLRSGADVSGAVLVFREVAENRRTTDNLLRAQKFEALGIFAAGIANELNQIMTIIFDNLALAKIYARDNAKSLEELNEAEGAFAHARGLTEQFLTKIVRGNIETLEALTEAERAFARARELTEQFLTFSYVGVPVKTACSLSSLLRECARLGLSGTRVSVEFSIIEDLWPVGFDPVLMHQALAKIVANAVEAMPRGGILTIEADNVNLADDRAMSLPPGPYVCVSIADTGVGISPTFLQRIFDPYFSTKQTGSGLGLAISYAVIKKHNGHIEVNSLLGEGTTMRIYLPAARG